MAGYTPMFKRICPHPNSTLFRHSHVIEFFSFRRSSKTHSAGSPVASSNRLARISHTPDTHLVDRSFDISVPLERDGGISTVAIGSPSVCFESDSDRSRETATKLRWPWWPSHGTMKERNRQKWRGDSFSRGQLPSTLPAFSRMTSFLCGARNVAWSKHVAMSGSVRCGTHQCSCQVCCRNWERKREREKLSTLNYHRVSTMKIHSRYSHPWNLVDSIDHEDREIWSQVDTFLFLGSTRLSKHPVTLYIYIYIDQVR